MDKEIEQSTKLKERCLQPKPTVVSPGTSLSHPEGEFEPSPDVNI